MRFLAFSVYDSAADFYDVPMFLRTDEEAVRLFSDIAVSAETTVGKHPECYSLFCIGDFQNSSAELSGLGGARCLITGLAAVARAQVVEPKQVDAFNGLDDDMPLESRDAP